GLLALPGREGAVRRELEAVGLSWNRLRAEFAGEQMPAEALPLDEPLALAEETTRVDATRVLDACANRAREALRVVEDYCRFVLDDRFLSGELKRLRHDLAEALGALPAGALLAGRDTLGDVGTTLTTAQEQQRHSLAAVVQ